jgi:hypothetical protein
MKAVSAQVSVRAKQTPQSTNPAAVKAQLSEMQRWLAAAKAR